MPYLKELKTHQCGQKVSGPAVEILRLVAITDELWVQILYHEIIVSGGLAFSCEFGWMDG